MEPNEEKAGFQAVERQCFKKHAHYAIKKIPSKCCTCVSL